MGIRITGVVANLLIINVLLFFGSFLMFGGMEISSTGNVNLGRAVLAMFYPDSVHFQPHQIVTHMFMHADIRHLLFNMIGIFFFGPILENLWGAKRFLFFYFIAGFGSLILHLIFWYFEVSALSPGQYEFYMQNPGAYVLGASGALYGVLVAFALYFPNQKIMLLIPPIPIKAKYLVGALVLIDLFSGFSGASTGVAHFAHLGGALFGALLVLYWRRFGSRL